MNKYKEFIQSIKPIKFEKYANVSSREKLVTYTIKYLSDNNIPPIFNYICIATYKLFPEKFYFSEDYKEYPHIEMLNRTILHLRPKERNYATGRVGSDYKLTPLGEEIAKNVEEEIFSIIKTNQIICKKIMDLKSKKSPQIEMINIKNSSLYKKLINNEKINDMEIWDYFKVTPYSQLKKINNYIKENKEYAKDNEEKSVIVFLDLLKEKTN